MAKTQLDLPEMQYDLLKELFNLGLGSAAHSLSQLVHQEVILSVPKILFETPEQLANRLGKNQAIFSVSQFMQGPFDMNSMLIFNPEDSFDVVKKMLDKHLSDEILTELQSEALTEIGNIVLNSCISVVGEAIGGSFHVQLPVYRETNTDQLIEETTGDGVLISVVVKIELKGSSINGHLVFVLNADSMSNLYKTLELIVQSYE